MKSASEIPTKKDVCIDKIMTELIASGIPAIVSLSNECIQLRSDIINDFNQNGYYARIHQYMNRHGDMFNSKSQIEVKRANVKPPKRVS